MATKFSNHEMIAITSDLETWQAAGFFMNTTGGRSDRLTLKCWAKEAADIRAAIKEAENFIIKNR